MKFIQCKFFDKNITLSPPCQLNSRIEIWRIAVMNIFQFLTRSLVSPISSRHLGEMKTSANDENQGQLRQSPFSFEMVNAHFNYLAVGERKTHILMKTGKINNVNINLGLNSLKAVAREEKQQYFLDNSW